MPPAFGIAVASSAVLSRAGRIMMPASRQARTAAGPASDTAIPGSRNMPELIIAPVLSTYTSNRPSSFRKREDVVAMLGSGTGLSRGGDFPNWTRRPPFAQS